MGSRATCGSGVRGGGGCEEAEGLFADAGRRQEKRQPIYPLLYSIQGYWYFDLLFARRERAAARDRAAKNLAWEIESDSLLDRGLVHLSLGRAYLGIALEQVASMRPAALARDNARVAQSRLGEAVEGLRAAGSLEYVPHGLLARAAFRRSVGDRDGAARDLDEVEEIAEPGPMRLSLCDMALERARLAFARIAAFAPLTGLIDDGPPQPEPPAAAERGKLANEARANLAA